MKTINAKPTSEQLIWQELELGVLIHYVMEIYDPTLTAAELKSDKVREALHPSKINPSNLDPEQWVRSAWEMGAKYAVLVTNHCTGFSLWPTKVNDYCTRSLAWKDGNGDIVGEFISACKKYGLKPGLYYSVNANGYYNISDWDEHDYQAPYYQEYLRNVEAQITELWTEYGPLFEIWFDGGVLPAEEGGLQLEAILRKYQPNALCFQGPRRHPHNLRWVGNENGLAPEDCWATTNAGDVAYDGMTEDENAGIGNPDGKYYWPAETDTPNRAGNSYGGGWAWKNGESHLVRSPEELLDCYIKSAGRNSNLLLGMAINTDGQFEDEKQFIAFGKLLRETFGQAIVEKICGENEQRSIILNLPKDKSGKYLVIREKIDEGQHIRGFRILSDGEEVYSGACIGHKRIVPLDMKGGSAVTFEITDAIDGWKLRDIGIY